MKQQIEHALVAAVRNFAIWLSTTHILLNITFGRSALAAAVAAAAAAVVDYVGAPLAGSVAIANGSVPVPSGAVSAPPTAPVGAQDSPTSPALSAPTVPAQ